MGVPLFMFWCQLMTWPNNVVYLALDHCWPATEWLKFCCHTALCHCNVSADVSVTFFEKGQTGRSRNVSRSQAMLYGLVTQCADWFSQAQHCMFLRLCGCLLVAAVLSGSLKGKLVLQAKQEAEEEARAARQAEEEAQAILAAKEEARAARQAEREAQVALKAEQQARAALQAELEAQSALRAEEAARAARRAEEEAMAAQQAKAQAEVSMLGYHYVTAYHICICTTFAKILEACIAVIGGVMFGSSKALWLVASSCVTCCHAS